MTATLQTIAGVHVDTHTLLMGKHSITGIISLQIGDAYFPEREWSDFPVVILGWWLTELLQLWGGESETTEGAICAFMDGAFYYRVSTQGERWLIECIDDSTSEEAAFEAEVERAAFMKTVLTCAAQILDTCRAHGWQTLDTDELATIIARAETDIVSPAA